MRLFDIFKKKAELTEDQKKSNKMWELWSEGKADSPYSELMTYQSEINNGGHDQYFTNVESTGNLQKETTVLETILPPKLKQNYHKAYQAYLVLKEKEGDHKAEEIMEQCDDVFFENEEMVNQALKKYAAKIKL